jgi:hypothetical protein
MTDNLTQSKFLWRLGQLLAYAQLQGIRLICSSFFRTAEQQAELYKIGRRGIPGEQPITTCDGITKISRHQTKMAIDLNVIDSQGDHVYDMPPYIMLGKYWELIGGTWGGNWTSSPEHWHFDMR